MSISPPGDIVLDVARAADPQRALAAIRRLQQSAGGTGDADFAVALDKTRSVPSPAPTATPAPVHASEISGRGGGRGASSVDPYKALGGLVLQKAIEQMMPASSASTFGAGTAGAVWKSALAEHLAAALSASVFKSPVHDDRMRAGNAPAVAASSVAPA
jgi:peptidoglycan hydrolase FlgJ